MQLHLFEIYRIGKSIKTESTLVVTKSFREWEWGITTNGYSKWAFFWDYENDLELGKGLSLSLSNEKIKSFLKSILYVKNRTKDKNGKRKCISIKFLYYVWSAIILFEGKL